MTGLLLLAALAVLTPLLPDLRTPREYLTRDAPPPAPHPGPRRRPRSPYARAAAEARAVDVSRDQLVRPYYCRAAETTP